MFSEACLKRADDGLTQSGEHSLWPRRCPNPVDDVLRPWVDEDLEELLAALGVVRQRSVCEAKPADVIRASDRVEDAATVLGPEPEMSNQYRHGRPGCDRRAPRERFDPADIEVLPGQ